jgi:hypothetical protein
VRGGEVVILSEGVGIFGRGRRGGFEALYSGEGHRVFLLFRFTKSQFEKEVVS